MAFRSNGDLCDSCEIYSGTWHAVNVNELLMWTFVCATCYQELLDELAGKQVERKFYLLYKVDRPDPESDQK